MSTSTVHRLIRTGILPATKINGACPIPTFALDTYLAQPEDTSMTSQRDQLTLTDIQREHPTWQLWRAVSGRYLARPADAEPGDPAPITAGTLLDLSGRLRDADPLQRMNR